MFNLNKSLFKKWLTAQTLVALPQYLFFLLPLLLSGLSAQAQDVWTGNVSSDWNAPGNWADGSTPTAADNVEIPNATNDPVISGVNSLAKSVWVKSDGVLKLQPGAILTVNGNRAFGTLTTGFFNEGLTENSGKIALGTAASVGRFGLLNHNAFNNRPGGEIHIDRSTEAGLNNNIGVFTNEGKIVLGALESLGSKGLWNANIFWNQNGGEIYIDRSGLFGLIMESSAQFFNSAKIVIGSVASPGGYGILSSGLFSNSGGEISIERTTDTGIYNFKTFTNTGKISIGKNTAIGFTGLWSQYDLYNYPNGQITIDRAGLRGINISAGACSNYGSIVIGSVAGVGKYGIYNQAYFTNHNGGEIAVDRATESGLNNFSGDFNNGGKIVIGANAGVGLYGIWNQKNILNLNTGEMIVGGSVEAGVYQNAGVFKNEGKMAVGGLTSPGKYGLLTLNGFNNNTDGEITIDRSTESGLFHKAGLFTNKARIAVGDNQSVGTYGLNIISDFKSLPGGDIEINRAAQAALYVSGQFANSGKIAIGTKAPAGFYGIWSKYTFYNNAGGEISIDNSTGHGLFNETGTFVNKSKLYIGANSSVGELGIIARALFVNDTCAELYQYAPLAIPTMNSMVENRGLYLLSASAGHANSGSFKNNGVLCYPLGNPVPGVVNYDLIVGPIAAECGAAVKPALGIGNSNSFIASNTWYRDEALTQTAGTYEQNTNTFKPNGFTGGTNYTFYLAVYDGLNACATWTLPISYRFDDLKPPVVTCKPATVSLDAFGKAALTPASVFLTGTDNCGAVNLQSVTPNAFGCSNLGTNTVTLVVNDGNGNTAACNALVTVADAIPPTMLCKSATVNLNAAGQAVLTVSQVNNGSYDNCTLSALVLSNTQFTCANVGNNAVILRGLDQSNNMAQCTATVIVKDITAPVARCKNATLIIGASGTVALDPSAINNGTTDNCSYALTANPYNFTCAQVGTNVATLKATDIGGNTATCTAVVYVKDLTAPVAQCKNAVVTLNDLGQGTLNPALLDNGSTDNCGIISRTASQTQFNCSEIQGSPWPVTLTVKDAYNNSATCSAQVTVKDPLAPTAICENTSVQLGQDGMVAVYPAELALNSFDNCSVWSFSPVAKIYTSANLGANNLSIAVKDWSNNSANCISVVTVLPYSGFQGAAENRTIRQDGLDLSLQIYPNPSEGLTNLKFQLDTPQACRVAIYDLSGRVVFEQQIAGQAGENHLSIDLKNAAPGLYIVDLNGGFPSVRKKLIKTDMAGE